MWALIALAAGVLGASAASNQDKYRRESELKAALEAILMAKVPTLLESLEHVIDVYAVYLEGETLGWAYFDKGAAMYRGHSEAEEGTHGQVDVVLLRLVPTEIAEQLILQGTSNQQYSDMYEAGTAAAPYVTEPALWEFNRERDSSFLEWPEEVQNAAIEREIEKRLSHGPTLAAGTLLYTGFAEADIFDEEDSESPEEVPLTNDKSAATDMARENAAFLQRVFKRPHQPRVITWRLIDDHPGLMALEGEEEKLSEMLEVDFSDLDFDTLRETGKKVEDFPLEERLRIGGWINKGAFGPGKHSIALLEGTLEFVSIEDVAQLVLPLGLLSQ